MWFEDVPLDEEIALGRWRFNAEDVAAYARRYQYGRQLTRGVDGWHICAVWNRLWVLTARTMVTSGAEEAGTISPGILNLQWPTAVVIGQELTFSSEAFEKIPLRSRPTLGIVKRRNLARGADGSIAMEFIGQVLHSRWR